MQRKADCQSRLTEQADKTDWQNGTGKMDCQRITEGQVELDIGGES